MRCESVASIKGNSHFQNPKPREGTRLREVYDLFYLNKGLPVEFFHSGKDNSSLIKLIDFYGLDIRCISRGKWVLAGEWFGKVYVDYIAEHIK